MGGSKSHGTGLSSSDEGITAQIKKADARESTCSLERASFPKRVCVLSNNEGIEYIDAQPSRANVEYESVVGTVNYSKGREAHSVVVNSDIVGNNQKDAEVRLDSGTNGNKTLLSTTAFPNYYNSWTQWYEEIVIQRTSLWYKEYILYGVLRRREIPSTNDGRHIQLNVSRDVPLIDERTGKHFISNAIRSSRYTIWNFLPYQLWFQFSKTANLFFLVTGVLQLIPDLSTTGTYATILPLVFFLSFSIAREGYDDFRRYRLDNVENKRLARVLYGYRAHGSEEPTISSLDQISQKIWKVVKSKIGKYGEKCLIKARAIIRRGNEHSVATLGGESDKFVLSPWVTVKWIDLRVGDVIELKRDDRVPADIVLLYVDGRNGIAYIETMALDGESNLKSKQPPPLLAKSCGTLTELSSCTAYFVVEDPNTNLYEFNGKVSVDGETCPLTPNNIAYRGSTLRNTTRAVGMVINTGEECKIRMNSSRNPQTKAPAIQIMTNRVVIFLSILLILLSIGCTVGYTIWTREFEDNAWYLAGGHLFLVDVFIAFIIEFNNLIPLALYVSMEIIKFAQFLLLRDIEMYDPISDTPMTCNTQTIIENLGQVNFLFSDKTGTLTENVMRFQKMSVAGIVWQHRTTANKEVVSGGKENIERVMDKKSAKQTHQLGDDVVPKAARASVLTSSPLQNKDSPLALPAHLLSPLQMDSTVTLTDSQRQPHTDELVKYLRRNPSTILAQRARIFLLSLAICHTCFPEVEKDGKIGFQAASPDELALVEAARDLGYIIVDRVTQSITLLTHSTQYDVSVQETYEILDIIEFSSKRKRMSIIVRFPNGEICIFCKGADSVMKPRIRLASSVSQKISQSQRQYGQYISEETKEGPLPEVDEIRMSIQNDYSNVLKDDSQSSDRPVILERCLKQIDDFASEGLRTLIYGYRFIDDGEYSSWKKIYHHATTSLVGRQEMIESAGELIEQDFDLAGATAIEDRLQKGVPETIDKLRRANIRIWMLTGDKRETAINVAYSARICKKCSRVFILDHENHQIQQQMASLLLEVTDGKIAHSVLVIDGQTLAAIEIEDTLIALFYELVLHIDSVIFCRASPCQKAKMVKEIRQRVNGSITLAVGDGGNDIAMIQEAHVGVGISGKEGLQAARVADYAIAQFRFLQRLLLVHGHWNYVRTAKYILLTFWKEMLFYSVLITYQRWNGYTGTSLYESDSLTVWNTLFTSLPVMLPGIFEQDVSAATLLAVPELYSYGQESREFNMRKYALWMIMAGCESQIIYFMVYSIYGIAPPTGDQSIFSIGDLAFSICVVFINVKLLVLQYQYKTWIPLFGAALTIFGWWAWNLFLSATYYNTAGPYGVFQAFTNHFGRDPTWWAVLIAVLAVLIIPELVIDTLKKRFWPNIVEIWQEMEQDKYIRKRLEASGNIGNEVGSEGGILT